MIWYPYQQMKTMQTPYAIVAAAGVSLYTRERRMIDSVSSWWSVIHGYKHPALNQVLVDQAGRFSHVMLGGLTHAPAQQLAEKLGQWLPGELAYSFFSDSGSVAVEVALKMALQYFMNRGQTQRTMILALEHAYHGDTFKTMEAGDDADYHFVLQAYGPSRHVVHIPTEIPALEEAFLTYHDRLNCLLVEPLLQGAGGMRMYDVSFLQRARALCDQYGVLLIFDEVITGFRLALGGAQAYYGVTPDLSTFAKAIASGYPFGAVVGRREVMACGVPASGTFNGNPIGVAAALATIETLSQPGVYAHLEGLAQQLETGFRALARKYHRPLYLRHVGSIFILYFGFTEDVEDFRDWLTQADLASYTRFVAGCEEYGVRFTDRRGREYLSVAHTQEDIQRTLAVADQVLGEMERGER